MAFVMSLAVYVYVYLRGKPLDAVDMPVIVGVCLAITAFGRWMAVGRKKGGKQA
ncbi:MAG: hypothetical protein JST11_25755 [Acidobacteria bacterium]|nr:hypothetical protein [Acidobacteriota bacterium]